MIQEKQKKSRTNVSKSYTKLSTKCTEQCIYLKCCCSAKSDAHVESVSHVVFLKWNENLAQKSADMINWKHIWLAAELICCTNKLEASKLVERKWDVEYWNKIPAKVFIKQNAFAVMGTLSWRRMDVYMNCCLSVCRIFNVVRVFPNYEKLHSIQHLYIRHASNLQTWKDLNVKVTFVLPSGLFYIVK